MTDKIDELIRQDEERWKATTDSTQYSVNQRRNIYCGKEPGPNRDEARDRTAGWVPSKPSRPPPEPLTMKYAFDSEIDRLIHRDDALLLGGPNGYAELPPSQRMELYCGTSKALQSSREQPWYAGMAESRIPLSLKKRGSRAVEDSKHTLSNFPLDGISERQTEGALFEEYEQSKKQQYVLDLVAEAGSEEDESGETNPEVRQARAEARKLLEQEKRRKEIYARAKDRPKNAFEPIDGANRSQTSAVPPTTSPSTFSYSNSKLPGPYFTMDHKGEYTRFEALHNRFKMYRSPQSLWNRNQKQQAEAKEKLALPDRSGKGKKKNVDLDAVNENGETERLRRWKYQMGLLE